MPNSIERPVDLMIDLRERMIRIETLLDYSAKERLEIDLTLATHALKINALETEAHGLKSTIRTLKWVVGAAIAFLATFGSSLTQLFKIIT